MTQFSYQILFDPANVSPTDITDFAERVEWNEVGTGEVRNAIIRINAQDGQFITRGTALGTGVVTPILKQFDKISIAATDRLGNNKLHVFEVDILKPIQNAQQGAILEVQLLGLENQLMRVNFAKPFFLQGGISGFGVTKSIVDFYNDGDSKGGLQPLVIGNDITFVDSFDGILGFNELPVYTASEYHFELTEQSALEGLITVADRLGSSVASGGGGDFFEIYFDTDLTNVDQLLFKGFISGNPPSQQTDPDNGDTSFDFTKAIVINDTVAINPAEEEGGIESIKGNLTGTWGADGLGTLPRLNARFQGALEAYLNFTPFSQNGVTYPKDSIVQTTVQGTDGMPQHFIADVQTTTNPETNPTLWTLLTFETYLPIVGAVLNYSAWTQGIPNAWRNAGAKVDGTTELDPPEFNKSLSAWDSNLVMIDGTHSRTWAHVATTDSTQIRSQFLYGGQFFYRGFRVLINGTPADTPGNIFFGKGFENKIIKFNGTDFVIFRDPDDQGLCSVDEFAVVFVKTGGTWAASNQVKGNDSYHPVWSIGADQGHNNTLLADGVQNFGQVSAVTYEYRWLPQDVLQVLTANSPVYYRPWVGANWQLPFSPNSFNGQTIGDEYGFNADKREPVTIDVSNMHFASNGAIGFNHDRAEDLGPLDSLSFYVKFLYTFNFDGTGGAVAEGNFAFRCAMYDTSDNVVIQDFNIPFNGEWAQISLPVNNFEIYRARRTVGLEAPVTDLFLQDREILQVFEYQNIQKICIHWMGPYDDIGRYNVYAMLGIMGIKPNGFGFFGYNVKLTIDSFEFSKVGLAISDPEKNDRAIQPRFFDDSQISNFIQLRQANQAHLELSNFQETRFDTVTEGLFDIQYGESYFLENKFIVNNSDLPDGAGGFVDNTVKLVAKKINYVIDKRPDVPGGFLRTIEGAKRVE